MRSSKAYSEGPVGRFTVPQRRALSPACHSLLSYVQLNLHPSISIFTMGWFEALRGPWMLNESRLPRAACRYTSPTLEAGRCKTERPWGLMRTWPGDTLVHLLSLSASWLADSSPWFIPFGKPNSQYWSPFLPCTEWHITSTLSRTRQSTGPQGCFLS